MGVSLLEPILLTLLAGLATGVGSLIAFFSKTTNKSFFAATLGFSAGIMIFVSFVEMFDTSKVALTEIIGLKQATIVVTISFFVGVFFIAVIDFLIPDNENPHEVKDIEDTNKTTSLEFKKAHALKRMGVTTALVIAIHNFPEGFATFMAGTQDLSVAMSVAIAIAIHNIPEGIAVSVPIYFATGSKKKAFLYSALSGLAEPIGGIIGYLFFSQFFSDTVLNLVFSFVAGIMVFIAIDELLPAAESYGKHHYSIYGFVLGMLFMSISLIMFM
jgi:zinc transporter, ZIP family